MKPTDYLFYVSSCRAWRLPNVVHSVSAAFKKHSIVIVKLDSRDPPRRLMSSSDDIDVVAANWKVLETSKWVFGKTSRKSMSAFTLTAYRQELILQQRGLNCFYASVRCCEPDDFFGLCHSLCAALNATHAYFDSIERINSRLHRVCDDGSVEKNPISIFQALPGLFRWNFFAPCYQKYLHFEQAGPEMKVVNSSEGIILTSLKSHSITYSDAEYNAIMHLGPRYFHLTGKPDFDCLAPSIDALAS
jgi:hypothetical protein